MGAFGGLIMTNKGQALQAKAQAGIALVFTRIGCGDGDLGGQSIKDLNALISEKMSLEIIKLKTMQSDKAVVGAILSNQELVSGFYFREIGVFATDPDEGEILYCYGNAGANAEYIPAGGGPDIVEKNIDVITIVGNASSVTAVIDESLIFVTETQFGDFTNGTTGHAHTGVDGDGTKIPTDGLEDGAITDVKIGDRAVDDTTIPTGDIGTLSNLFSWLGNMIKAITGKASWRTAPVKSIEQLNTDQAAHLADLMPHKFTHTDGKTYKYGWKFNESMDGLVYVYEEVL